VCFYNSGRYIPYKIYHIEVDLTYTSKEVIGLKLGYITYSNELSECIGCSMVIFVIIAIYYNGYKGFDCWYEVLIRGIVVSYIPINTHIYTQ